MLEKLRGEVTRALDAFWHRHTTYTYARESGEASRDAPGEGGELGFNSRDLEHHSIRRLSSFCMLHLATAGFLRLRKITTKQTHYIISAVHIVVYFGGATGQRLQHGGTSPVGVQIG